MMTMEMSSSNVQNASKSCLSRITIKTHKGKMVTLADVEPVHLRVTKSKTEGATKKESKRLTN